MVANDVDWKKDAVAESHGSVGASATNDSRAGDDDDDDDRDGRGSFASASFLNATRSEAYRTQSADA